MPKGLEQLGQPEETMALEALQALHAGDILQADRVLYQSTIRNPRNYIPRTLQGFSAVEKGDLQRALQLWKEAEKPLQQSHAAELPSFPPGPVPGDAEQAAECEHHV